VCVVPRAEEPWHAIHPCPASRNPATRAGRSPARKGPLRAASECYDTAFETTLTARLGVTFTPRPDTTGTGEPVREISHIPFGMIGTIGMITHFSVRRNEIETRYATLVRAYRREHGHDPPRAVCHHLARQANLDTREGKKPARSLAEMCAAWRASLTAAFGPGAVRQLMAAAPGPASPALATDAAGRRMDIGQMAERVVANVAAQRSTWTVWNLRAEAERLTRAGHVFRTLEEHRKIVEALTGQQLDAGQRDLVTAFAARSTLLAAGLGPAGAAGHLRRLARRHAGRENHADGRRHRHRRKRPVRPGPRRARRGRAGRARLRAVAGRHPGRVRRLGRHPGKQPHARRVRRPGLGQERRRLAGGRPA